MGIKVTCGECLTVYNLADNKAGTSVTCRKCEASIMVPARRRVEEAEVGVEAVLVEEDEPTLVTPLGDEEAEGIQSGRVERRSRQEVVLEEDRPVRSRRSRDEDEDERPRPRRRRRGDEDERGSKKSSLPLILGGVAGGLFLLIAVGGTLGWIFWNQADDSTSAQGHNLAKESDDAMKGFAIAPRVVIKEPQPVVDPREKEKERPKEKVAPPPPPPPPPEPLGPPKDIQEALARLRDSDPDRQKTASDWLQQATLSDFYRNEVAKALDPLLSNPKTKLSALLALTKWGTRDNLASVHPLLADAEGDVWRAAFDTLALIKDESSVEPVGKYLPDDAKGPLAEKVLRLVGKKGESEALKYLHHKVSFTRTRAGNLLKSYGTPDGTILDQTIQDLQGTDRDMRNWALQDRVLGTVDQSRQLQVGKALVGLLTEATLKQKAMNVLQTWATKENVPAVVGVLTDAQLRTDAIRLLGKLKDPRGADPLARLLSSPTDRGEASKALQQIGSPAEKSVLNLMPALVGSDLATRHEAFNVLGHIGTRASLPLLTGYLKVPALKGEAAGAIRKIQARGG
jgi:HEAT repeat protein